MGRWAAFVAVGLTFAAALPVRGADKPALDELMARAARYVDDFGARFKNVVAEERYRQRVIYSLPATNFSVTGRGGGGIPRSLSPGQTSRDLKSDFLLVTVPSSGEVVPFRDTFEVDGAEVRDRQQRLAKLFLESSASAFEQASAISTESARYNIGNLTRTINNPILALILLEESIQPRFAFSIDKADSSLGADVWIVEYRETAKPTIVRGTAGRYLSAHGRFWIEATSGRVRKTELLIEETNVIAAITTTFRTDATFQIDVPAEMQEQYRPTGSIVTGQATYGRFRRFGVKTEEELQK